MSDGNALNAQATDMTRWNRAGLARFQYTSEAAAEVLEQLRIAHLLLYTRGLRPDEIEPPEAWRKAFADDLDEFQLEARLNALRSKFSARQMWGVGPRNGSHPERLLAQYEAVLNDPALQISRAFSRAMHILTETLNAYANEGTLRTVTQTQHAQHLLSLIGFSPMPAASAIVPIAYQLKQDAGRTTLPAGLSFDYPLTEEGPNLTFEALETIVAHPSLNELRFDGFDTREDEISADETEFQLVEKSTFSNDLVNTYAVLRDTKTGSFEAVRIKQAYSASGKISVGRSSPKLSGYMQTAELACAPRKKWPARPRGNGWINFDDIVTIYPQAIVYVTRPFGEGGYYRVAEVRGKDARLLPLDPFMTPHGSAVAERLLRVNDNLDFNGREEIEGAGRIHTENRGAGSNRESDQISDSIVLVQSTLSGNEGDAGVEPVTTGTFLSLLQGEATIHHLRKGTDFSLSVDLDADKVYLDGVKKSEISSSEHLVFELAGGSAKAAPFSFGDCGEDWVSIVAEGANFDHQKVTAVYADFSSVSKLIADTRSNDEILDEDNLVSVICPANQQSLLQPGRKLLLEKDDRSDAVESVVKEVHDTTGDVVTLSLESFASLTGFTRGFTVVRANVATHGHGKTLPPRVLGSGDGGRDGQFMPLEEDSVSTVMNPTFPGGVALDLEVTVEGRIWRQVAEQADDVDEGPNYSVVVQANGDLGVQFHRRLPTGEDNVVVTRIRSGAGREGNDIPAYGVKNLQPKHAAVESVVQPLAPVGGADLEGVEELRREGKSRYSLFGRALALDDFARLAETHTAVLHASSRLIRQGGGRGGNRIIVTVAPSGGGDIDPLREDIEQMLLGASLPGTSVVVDSFNAIPLTGRCILFLKPGYADQSAVERETQALLLALFGLPARPLGEALYVSELVAAIESHDAVEYVNIELDPLCATHEELTCEHSAGGLIQVLRPDRRTSVYLSRPEDLVLDLRNDASGGLS